MKISTKGRYGLRAMFDICLDRTGEPIPLSGIAERQLISLNYLEQIMTLLKKAKLVGSARGAQGGYYLLRPASEITIGEILRALVGSLAPIDCLEERFDCEGSYCVTRKVYSKMYKGILGVVDNMTLEDMKIDYEANVLISEISDLTTDATK